jgi:hypothetical protein
MKYFIFAAVLVISVNFSYSSYSQARQEQSLSPVLIARSTNAKLDIDGKLNEPAWNSALLVNQFVQVEPDQGKQPLFKTEVKLLTDQQNLYIGVFAKDPDCRKNLRVGNLARDFSFDDNDLFGIAIDAFNTKRNALAFQVTPFGTQRDLQTFDDAIFDTDWDAVWTSKTTITDSGWYAEIAIPFQSIRFNPTIKEWGINFIRISRATNEISAFPGYPRSFDTYQMAFTASLVNLQIPASAVNLRLNPYTLYQTQKQSSNGTTTTAHSIKAGGDLKWAVTQHGAIDATFNTDFAQADVDRQVINLSRFSVYFPERRQFFLENSGLFLVGDGTNIEPFFSRSIGLDTNGSAVPLIAGLKFTDRTSARSYGLINTLEQGNDSTPNTNATVLSGFVNYGKANNIGVLATNRYQTARVNNTVLSLTGLNRIGQGWRIHYLLSGSHDISRERRRNGLAGNLNINLATNKLYFISNHSIISRDYIAKLGFISRGNLLSHTTSIIPVFRPAWKPRYIRSIQPGIVLNIVQEASSLRMQEGAANFFPLYLIFNNGSLLSFRYQFNWQLLTDNFYLSPATISKNNYYFNRFRLKFNTDLSKPVSFSGSVEEGGYYDGTLFTVQGEFKFSPSPRVSLINAYELNELSHIGINKSSFKTDLFTSTLRLALNQNIQLTSFYQYVGSENQGRINIRFSWQISPLSYIYLIFNSNNRPSNQFSEQQGICKINFLRNIK